MDGQVYSVNSSNCTIYDGDGATRNFITYYFPHQMLLSLKFILPQVSSKFVWE